MMEPIERVKCALKREGLPDRVPFEISWGAFTPGLMKVFREKTGTVLTPEEYFDFDTRSVDLAPTKKKTDFSKYFTGPIENNAEFSEWGFGAVPGSKEHFMEFKYHPLAGCETAEDVLAYDWPDIGADYRYRNLPGIIESYHDRGYPVIGEMYSTIFEMAWLLRGMEDMLTDFYLNEDIGHAICDKLGEIRRNQAIRYAKLGVDVIRLGDDVCTQTGPLMSLEVYRKYIKEPTRDIIKAAKSVNPEVLIFMHCDGKVESFIEEYIDMGVDVLNPIQPECNDLEMIARLYGDRLSFWGGVGTQSVMPFGSPEEVAANVKGVINTLGRDGGFLIAPSHILEPEVPWENVIAFIETVKEFRY